MKNGKHILIGLVCLSTLFVACSEEPENIIPSDIIEEAVFTKVLLELQLVEAHINEPRVDQVYIKDSAENYFSEIFEKNNVSKEAFGATMEYYTTKPTELQTIYDNVLNQLSEMEAELADVQLDQEAISPIGKHVIVDIIMTTSMETLFTDTLMTKKGIQDSLFRHLINEEAVLDSFNTNLASFQKSYIGITYKEATYISLREEIRRKVKKLEE